MGITSALLWYFVLSTLNAPTWCWVVYGISLGLSAILWILKIIAALIK